MTLKILDGDFCICKLHDMANILPADEIFFLSKTDEEISLVCKKEFVPAHVLKIDSGWRCFRIQGEIDFALTGILSKILNILAEQNIGIFAVSTYNTDYILTKKENFDIAVDALLQNGYNLAK
ncbi:MAG: ACT domain-containing protein [Spirochaetales bacterium]